ncbi:GMC family oxidoreductase [Nocardioides zeae]|uniref:Cholesterol oxidase n=1 Tax=Nocardioides imazamoxiresistens TaxID=3231893 RepID=A0ABU3Q0Z5_9ACTN|nr:GMC family oxidoreductase [Nocardioides zeae]MDT9595188.1 GMC family oxidoreductase [Nocardioides zeae]
MAHDYDVLVIGSGFGGSVTALRLTEKGYRVGVLEAGRRFADDEFATTSWRLRDYVFAPRAGLTGIQRMDLLGDVLVLSGAGVGGGSLVYANTLYEPPEAFYRDPSWAHLTDWRDELRAPFDQARRMLGVTTYPRRTPSDVVMRDAADGLGVGATFVPTPIGVLRAEDHGVAPGAVVPDPWFGGRGPQRRACTDCGSCMTGCRVGAKNTLVKNYLHLAEEAGAEVHPLTTVTDVRPLPGGGYAVTTRASGSFRAGRTFTADQVVVSAAALGTQKLLHRLKASGSLPHLSDRLGELSRTNSEAILGVRAKRSGRHGRTDFSEGVAITSSIHLDDDTHVEPVRYGPGSNAMALLMATLADPEPGVARWRIGLRQMWRNRRSLLAFHDPRDWSERTIVLLVMQSLDNSLTTSLRSRRLRRGAGRRLTARPGVGEPNPVWIPAGHALARRIAEQVDGEPAGAWNDLVDVPTTGHFIGGCPMGESAAEGVIDPYHRVHGHPGLHVVDGSAVCANLGVNPSLSITALAERAVALWPNKGQADPRPPLGEAYRRVAPVAPAHPVVPADAPGALRIADREPA